MIKKLIGLTLFTMLISGCATDLTTNVNYYLLDDATTTITPISVDQRPIKIKIDTFELADYLNQTNLCMQLEGHQIYYSKHHFWAQPLQSSLLKSLLNDLNLHSSQGYFYTSDTVNDEQPDLKMGLSISHFLPTHQSSVVMSGQYWFYDSKTNNDLSKRVFNFKYELPLKENGFPHSVKQLRLLLPELSKELVKNMESIKN